QALQRQQPLEERTITAQRKPQVLRRCLVRLVELTFELRALAGKSLSQALHHPGYELVALANRSARIVDEAALNGIPLTAKVLGDLRCKERRKRRVFGPAGGASLVGCGFADVAGSFLLRERRIRVCRGLVSFPQLLVHVRTSACLSDLTSCFASATSSNSENSTR